jgi:outer membrane protein assembly factor BamD (BamD/ComL family)
MNHALVLLTFLLLFGCGDPAKDKFETAQFEEQQFNRPHAIQLYREIVSRHPDSPYATQAAARLEALLRKD